MQRQPAVAGQFYPGNTGTLRQTVHGLLPRQAKEMTAAGIVSPHAGYRYSGGIAGETFARVHVPQKVVLLGPNHHGIGHRAAVYASGSWLSPLGETLIDEDLAGRILLSCPVLAADTVAHSREHSLEVQLPFIQVRAPGATIVPICLGSLSLEELLALGEGLGKTLAETPEEVLIVASSDMTHYEEAETARTKDMRAIDRILELDAEGLFRTVRDGGITMCGVLPTVVMLGAVRFLGAVRGELVRYGNSGEVSGDHDAVVGYAGVVVPAGEA
jgi:hypothetical protein